MPSLKTPVLCVTGIHYNLSESSGYLIGQSIFARPSRDILDLFGFVMYFSSRQNNETLYRHVTFTPESFAIPLIGSPLSRSLV